MNFRRDYITYKNSDEVWKILNENLFNIEDKLISMAIMLNLEKDGFTYSCRKISGKNKCYNYKLACNINYCHKLLFRFYYEPEKDKRTYRIFGSFMKGCNSTQVIESEQQLDELLVEISKNIFNL